MYTVENKQYSSEQALQERLECQYGPAIAQEIMDRLQQDKAAARPAHKAPDYMDVKAMSEMAEQLRAQAMMDIWRLREWRKHNGDNRPSHKNLISLEGVSLQRQCTESIKLYRQTHKAYFDMFRAAMEAIKAKPVTPYIVSRYCA